MGDTGADPTPASARLRLTFEAFCETHEHAWRGFARTQVGEKALGAVIENMKDHLLANWNTALRQELPAAYAWRLLKEHVASRLSETGQPPALVETAAFDAVILRFQGLASESLRTLPGQMTFYRAILELPERQHDVVVLRYLLDMDEEEIAKYLGTPLATVRSNVDHARRRLARSYSRTENPESSEPQELKDDPEAKDAS